MNRTPLMTIPADTHPLYGEFVKVTQISSMTPGEIAKTFLYDYDAGGQVVAHLSNTAGAAPGSKVGTLELLAGATGNPLHGAILRLYDIAKEGQWPGSMDFDQPVRLELLADAGIQLFKRSGPDGKTLSFIAMGRENATPTGGVEEFAAVMDAKPAGRTNIGALIDKLLDAGDAGTLVFTDGDAERNPEGIVVAIDTALYAANVAALNALPNLEPLLPAWDELQGMDGASTLTFEFGALPASSSNPNNFQ